MKEKIYKKVQDLFPSTLAVGDVVELKNGSQCKVLKIETITKNNETFVLIRADEWVLVEYVKLLRKNITLSMVLEAMYKKFHNSGNYVAVFQSDFKAMLEFGQSDQPEDNAEWILRKDGKDLSLYDQSVDLIKLVYEVLK